MSACRAFKPAGTLGSTHPRLENVVVTSDPDLPRNTWPKGRVTQVLPDAEVEVRVTRGLVLRRPAERIVVPTKESPDGDGGRNVHDSNVLRWRAARDMYQT